MSGAAKPIPKDEVDLIYQESLEKASRITKKQEKAGLLNESSDEEDDGLPAIDAELRDLKKAAT